MKHLSRFFSVFLVLTMIIGIVSATPDTTKTNINNDGSERVESKRTYRVYQIFTGTQVEKDDTSSVDAKYVEIGKIGFAPVFAEDFLTTLTDTSNGSLAKSIFGNTNPYASATSAFDVANVLKGYANDSAEAQLFAVFVYNYIKQKDATFDGTVDGTTNPVKYFQSRSFTATDSTESIPNEVDKMDELTTGKVGYYIAIDTGSYIGSNAQGTSTDMGVRNLALLQLSNYDTVNYEYLAKEFELYEKVTKPDLEKKVKDKNDSIQATGVYDSVGWQDSADYDIGDDVPFRLTAKMGIFSPFTEGYSIRFNDTLDEGLTINADSIKVTYLEQGEDPDAQSIIKQIDAEVTDGDGGYKKTTTSHTLTVIIPDLLDVPTSQHAVNSDVLTNRNSHNKLDDKINIYVDFTAKLNKDAKIGSVGNANKASLDYTENPYVETNWNDSSTYSSTKEDLVRVFTYEITVTKTDGSTALAGAEFTLSKKNSSGAYEAVKLQDNENPDRVKYELTSAGSSSVLNIFKWTGLDDGDYCVHESKIPDGYNQAEDVYFTVKATHDETSDDPQLNSLGAYANQTATEVIQEDGTEAHPAYSVTYGTVPATAVTSENAGLPFTIENLRGIVLPETGGMGTQIFYVCGGVMLAMGVVLLITKKRMGETD